MHLLLDDRSVNTLGDDGARGLSGCWPAIAGLLQCRTPCLFVRLRVGYVTSLVCSVRSLARSSGPFVLCFLRPIRSKAQELMEQQLSTLHGDSDNTGDAASKAIPPPPQAAESLEEW